MISKYIDFNEDINVINHITVIKNGRLNTSLVISKYANIYCLEVNDKLIRAKSYKLVYDRDMQLYRIVYKDLNNNICMYDNLTNTISYVGRGKYKLVYLTHKGEDYLQISLTKHNHTVLIDLITGNTFNIEGKFYLRHLWFYRNKLMSLLANDNKSLILDVNSNNKIYGGYDITLPMSRIVSV